MGKSLSFVSWANNHSRSASKVKRCAVCSLPQEVLTALTEGWAADYRENALLRFLSSDEIPEKYRDACQRVGKGSIDHHFRDARHQGRGS